MIKWELQCIRSRYYSEPDSHVRDKIKVALDLSNYATKKN